MSSAPTSLVRAARSWELHEAATKYLPGGTSREIHDSQPHPLYAAYGAGCVVVDVDGNERIDFANNATSLIHGHAHAEITRAVVERVQRGTAFTLCSQEQIELASTLCERVASVDLVRFTNSGSEAVLYAIKAMRAFTGRPKIAKFEGCYHGNPDWAEVSLSSSPVNWGSDANPKSTPFAEGVPPAVVSDVIVLRFNDIEQLHRILPQHQKELAGVLVDVMPARIGLIPAEREWLRELRTVTKDLGLLLVSDEIVNYRWAYEGAQGHYDFGADLTTFGKLIGGGFPVGAVGGRGDIMEMFAAGARRANVPHGGTFNANPVTMTAGAVALRLLTRPEVDRLNALGGDMRDRISRLFASIGFPAHVTGGGSLFRIHMTQPSFADYRGYWDAVAGNAVVKRRQQLLYEGLLNRGILIDSRGLGAISTPMGGPEVDAFLSALHETVESIHLTDD